MDDMQQLEEALRDACRGSPSSPFFRSLIVAQDGRVDIVADNNHQDPAWQFEGLRPGLWRTYIRHEDGQPYTGAYWMVWVCNGAPAALLNQMIGRQGVDDQMMKALNERTSMQYIKTLDWQEAPEYSTPGGDYGIAIRTRNILSAEFYSFTNSMETEEGVNTLPVQEQWQHLPDDWRRTLERWYDCNSGGDHMGGEGAGARIGGAVLECESNGYGVSLAKSDQGQIIGILLGDMFEVEDNDSDEYDVVEHGEALKDRARPHALKPVRLDCIHGGDPGLENDTPNYISPFQITLEVDDLLSDLSLAAATRIAAHLIQKQRQYINPYIDLSHTLENDCHPSWSRLPLVSFNVDAAFWASLRSEVPPVNASVRYHLPRMHHIKYVGLPCQSFHTITTRGEAGLANGIVEWTAPIDWHRPSRPTVCPPEDYRPEPTFRYVGCGYAITPHSTYPPLKAAHIWRWVVKGVEEEDSWREEYYDPYEAHYQIGRQAKEAIEVLGQTALFICPNKAGKRERHFADIFALDEDKGLLFGWLRDKSKEGEFCAFALANPAGKETPPFRTITFETYGLPQVIPSNPVQNGTSVDILCRQTSTDVSLNLIADFEVQVPCRVYEKADDLWKHQIYPSIARHIIVNQLLHPLLLPCFQQRVKLAMHDESQIMPIYRANGDDRYWRAVEACVSRGQAPGDFGFHLQWGLDPYDWPPSKYFSLPSATQQPIDGEWKAPEGTGWHDPVEPRVDPSGQYEAIDVMSYVGNGHVLPPWATYPPDKARFVWSRVSQGQDAYKMDSSDFHMEDKRSSPSTLLDFVGQTVMLDGRDIIDVIGVDQGRSVVYGFSRTDEPNTFISFQVGSYIPSTKEGPDVEAPSLPQSKWCVNIGLPINGKIPQPPMGGLSAFRLCNTSAGGFAPHGFAR